MKSSSSRWCALLCGLGLSGSLAPVAWSLEPIPAPKPVPTPVKAAEAAPYGEMSDDLTLALFHKVKKALEERKEGAGPVAELAERQADLIKALNASQVLHRELVARALPLAGNPKAALSALHTSLQKDPDDRVRRAVVATLTQFKDAASVDALINGLIDSDEQVRGGSAAALGSIGDSKAGEALLKALASDEKPQVRKRAAAAVAGLREQKFLPALKQAMETEKDYRVQLAIGEAIRGLRPKDEKEAAEAEAPAPGEHKAQLSDMAKEMRGIEDKLRQDRHDQSLQTDQKQVEERLTQMIEQIEKMQQQSSSSSQQQQQNQQQQQQQQQNDQQNQGGQKKQASSPLADSKLGGSADRGALQAADVRNHSEEWAKLPPAVRDEIQQAQDSGVPERWRKRLEAYFVSITAEEAKEASK